MLCSSNDDAYERQNERQNEWRYVVKLRMFPRFLTLMQKQSFKLENLLSKNAKADR